jgi:hypothetical protein
MDERIRIFSLDADMDDDKSFYIPRKDMILIPYDLPNLDHEVAHMVEMTNLDRCLLSDWGMKHNGSQFFKNKAPFFAALAREARVAAIQRHMRPDLNTMRPLSNPYWMDEAVKNVPFGRFKSYEDVMYWVMDINYKTYAAWSLDRIRHEWQIRLNHIQNWMEIKVAA